MDLEINNYFSALTALIGLGTAWVGYKVTVAKKDSQLAESIEVTRMENPNVSISQWGKSVLWWIWGPLIFMHLILAVVSVVLGLVGNAAMSIFFIMCGLFMLIPMYFRKPDALCRSARFEVSENKGAVLKKAVKALNSSRMKIGSLSAEDGVIVAKRGVSWRSFGEVISVKIEDLETNKSIVVLESCPIEPGRLIDGGASRRNISEFQKHFLNIS